MSRGSQPVRTTVAVALTLFVLQAIPDGVLAALTLCVLWWALFRPVTRAELIQFGIAGGFFLVQNYVTLRAGLFEFRDKDVLLMPYYEPLLWGFYFLSMKRFISGRASGPDFEWKAVAGLLVTSLAFSLFAGDSRALLLATTASTALLIVLFHTTGDLQYAAFALALGFVVELFGVTTGLWSYPAPDFLGIPYWFATMWISVGLLGRRFLIPVSERLAARIAGQPV